MSTSEILKKIIRKIYNPDRKYEKIYTKRFTGLTEEEERYLLEVQFERMAGYKLNLDNPQTFNEKIQWLKLYYRDPLMTICSDKVAVREYVKEKIGEEYLIPIHGVYDNPEEIDFDRLPDRFVVKVNWGSGQNIIVDDKKVIDINSIVQKLKYWLRPENNHYYNFLEWAYKDIKPKIIIEKYIDGDTDLNDYKFFCYNGEPKNMFYVKNRNRGKENMTFNFFDYQFNQLNFKRLYKRYDGHINKPNEWDNMLCICRKLSTDFIFVRIDLYLVQKNIKFGEMTFYPGNGTEQFDPIEWDYKLGTYIKLNKFFYKN